MSSEKIQFGIVQGRLIQSPPGELQWFPQDYWESEFFLAFAVGFKYIELIAERFHNPDNPIWSDAGIDKIKKLCRRNNLLCYSACDDYIINNGVLGPKQELILKQMELFAQRAVMLNMQVIVLPLFEKSEINEENMENFIPILKKYADSLKDSGVTVCLETILDGKGLTKLIESLNCSNVKCVFDTGNRVAFGHDIYKDIKMLGDKIGHVHIKDRNSDNENVVLGDGLVNFYKVFESLKEAKYTNTFTFETNRGRNPIRTALFNKRFCEYCHSEVV